MEKVTARVGRPRSEQAREAVLHAVDDLLTEVGYAAMTMKGIAERAGVGRQTVYRWWSTKAEILFEASVIDAEQELAVEPTGGDAVAEISAYLDALATFLTRSDAGAAYRALVAAAQQDAAVAELMRSKDVLGDSARAVLERAVPADELTVSLDDATALLVGPTFFRVMTGRDSAAMNTRQLAEGALREIRRSVDLVG